jgi:hypothetical protein
MFREVAPQLSYKNRCCIDGTPLHGLKSAGEPERLAALDHERVGEDVGEGEAERHGGEQCSQPPIRMLRHQSQCESAAGGQGRAEHEVARSPPAEQRQEVRDQPVDRLDHPRHASDREERGDLARREPALLERDGDRLTGEVPGSLGEVDHAEENGQAPAVGGLEREEPA